MSSRLRDLAYALWTMARSSISASLSVVSTRLYWLKMEKRWVMEWNGLTRSFPRSWHLRLSRSRASGVWVLVAIFEFPSPAYVAFVSRESLPAAGRFASAFWWTHSSWKWRTVSSVWKARRIHENTHLRAGVACTDRIVNCWKQWRSVFDSILSQPKNQINNEQSSRKIECKQTILSSIITISLSFQSSVHFSCFDRTIICLSISWICVWFTLFGGEFDFCDR